MSDLEDLIDTSKRDKLSRRLEKEAEKLSGVRTEHFIDSQSLCSSCQHACIIRRRSLNHRLIHCSWFGKPVSEDIVECSVYQSYTELSLPQMVDIATLIGGVKERRAGFINEE